MSQVGRCTASSRAVAGVLSRCRRGTPRAGPGTAAVVSPCRGAAGTVKKEVSGPEGGAHESQHGVNPQPPGLGLAPSARAEQQCAGGQQRHRGVEQAGHDEPLVGLWFIVPVCLPCPGTTSSCTKSSQEAGPDTTRRYCSRLGPSPSRGEFNYFTVTVFSPLLSGLGPVHHSTVAFTPPDSQPTK